MTMSIRTNVGSLNAQRNLFSTQNQLGNTLSRLSSGYRITKAGDDAAGLAISETLRSQISGLNQAVRNANDAISMIQTAEGGMQEVHSMLQRMSQLANQASNGTLSDSNRSNINTELQDLKSEINAIAGRTKFNGMSLLNGDFTTSYDSTNSTLKVGTALATTATATVTDIDVSKAQSGTFTFSGSGSDLTLTDAAGNSQTISVDDIAANAKGKLNFDKMGISITLAATAAKTGADVVTDIGTSNIKTTGNGAAKFQIGAESGTENTLSVTFSSIKIESGNNDFKALSDALAAFGNTGGQTVDNANSLLTAVTGAIDTISKMRAGLGASQNRLEHTIANLNVTAENLSASESRIRDADVAEETAAMSRAQILMQAGVSVLAQANQMPQMALKLLG